MRCKLTVFTLLACAVCAATGINHARAETYPNGVALEMEPADLWAIATIDGKFLPPIEFDHPTKMPVDITDVSEEGLRKICTGRSADIPMHGCAIIAPNYCDIFVRRPVLPPLTRNLVIRHERGHCNGWSGNHEGIR